MKRTLAMIFLAVLTVGLLGSCTKNIEERLDKDEATLAELNAAIGQYEGLSGDITSVIEALRAEVGTRPASEQQSVWNCIAALQNQKGTFDTAIAALSALVGEKSVSVQIDEATSKLIEEYQLDGLASGIQAIKDKLSEKTGISALSDQVSALQGKVDVIAWALSKISDYEAMIQTVRINPAYTDGCVKSYGGILSFTFTVTPATALDGVRNLKGCLKLYANEVELKTKVEVFAEIPVTKAEITDPEKGEVTVEADVTDYLPAEKTGALSVALNIKTGVSNYTTDFATVFNIDCLRGLFTVNDEGKQVHFSKGNLWYDKSPETDGEYWNFEANQFDFHTYPGKGSMLDGIFSKESGTPPDTYGLFGWGDAPDNGNDVRIDELSSNYKWPVSGDPWGAKIDDRGSWRTLTSEEWDYIHNSESRGAARYAGANLEVKSRYATDTIQGVVLFPDNDASVSSDGNVTISGVEIKHINKCYFYNHFTAEEWSRLEAAGAVFLTFSGYRIDEDVFITEHLCYWSSTESDNYEAYYLNYHLFWINTQYTAYKFYGHSVRLVADVN